MKSLDDLKFALEDLKVDHNETAYHMAISQHLVADMDTIAMKMLADKIIEQVDELKRDWSYPTAVKMEERIAEYASWIAAIADGDMMVKDIPADSGTIEVGDG